MLHKETEWTWISVFLSRSSSESRHGFYRLTICPGGFYDQGWKWVQRQISLKEKFSNCQNKPFPFPIIIRGIFSSSKIGADSLFSSCVSDQYFPSVATIVLSSGFLWWWISLVNSDPWSFPFFWQSFCLNYGKLLYVFGEYGFIVKIRT